MNVSVRNLTFHFGSRNLFQNFNFEIDRTQFVLIQGPSGCGKSTFLKILARLISPQSGKIEYSQDVQKIGYVHQDLHLIEHWTICENLFLVEPDIRLHKIWLERFDLQMNQNSLVQDLSGGEKQRLSLIRIILSKPDLILLDEPTAHLDDQHTTVVLKAIKQEFSNKIILIVSHDQRVREFADQTIQWKKGFGHGA